MTDTLNHIPPEPLDVASLVDLACYPIHEPDCPRYREVIARGRRELSESGALELEGFVSPAGLERLQAEVAGLVPRSLRGEKVENPYATKPDGAVPEDHPSRITNSSQRHHVAIT